MARDFKKDQNSKTGLLCFSGNWKNPVLWSHYAEKHKGVCLGFDLREGTFEKVKYEDKRLGSELNKNDDDPTGLPKVLKEALLCTKSHHWKYEEEIRRLIPLNKADGERENLFWPFDANMRLIEVIVGERCVESVPSVVCIIDALTSELYVSKACLAFQSFNVVPDGKDLSTNLEQRIMDYFAGLKN
jgi:hypothetical protein